MNKLQTSLLIFGGLSVFGFKMLYQFYAEIKYCKMQLNILKNQFNPKELIKSLKKQDKKTLKLFYLKGNKAISEQIMINGILNSKNPILSKNQKQLILKLQINEERFSNQDFIPDQIYSYKREFQQYMPYLDKIKFNNFQINDFQYDNFSCQVLKENSNLHFIDQLETIDCIIKNYEINEIQKFLIYLSKILYGLFAIFGYKDLYGFQIGYEEKQLGLSVGQMANVIGQVVYNFDDQSLKLINPSIILKNPQIYKNILKQSILGCKLYMGLFGFITAIAFAKFSQYVIQLIKQQRKKYIRQQNKKNNLHNMINYLRNVDEIKCMICLDKTRSLIYKPCLHMATCSNCFESTKGSNCIVCRNKFSGTIDILIQC